MSKGDGEKRSQRDFTRSKDGEGLAMATTKYNFTDAQMFAILTRVNVPDEVIAEVMGEKYDAAKHTSEELARKVSHKYHVATKPVTKTESVAAKKNKAFAAKVVAELEPGKPFTLADIQRICGAEVASASKACAILNRVRELVKVDRSAPIDGKTAYIIL